MAASSGAATRRRSRRSGGGRRGIRATTSGNLDRGKYHLHSTAWPGSARWPRRSARCRPGTRRVPAGCPARRNRPCPPARRPSAIALLRQRKQDVGFDADHQRALGRPGASARSPPLPAAYSPMSNQSLARDRYRYEFGSKQHEVARMPGQIRLDLELDGERLLVALVGIEPDAREAPDPLHRRTIVITPSLRAIDMPASGGARRRSAPAASSGPGRIICAAASGSRSRNGCACAAVEMLTWARAARMLGEVGEGGHAAHRIAEQAGEAVDTQSAHQLEARALAASSSVSSGKSRRYGSPVAGSRSAGPVEPLHEPSVLAQITNQRSVSMCLPGPSIHQPGEGSSALEAACAPGDRPVRIRIALSRAAFSSPQVS